MFRGERELRQYDPTSSAGVPFYLFPSPLLTKGTATFWRGYFCQGRNLAVRFPRFDFPVFSAENVCCLCKVLFIVKAYSMSNQLGKFIELWWLSWRQAFREFSKQPIKIKRKCYRIKGLKLTQAYLTPVRLFIPTWLDCYKNKGTWNPNLDVLLPTRKSNVFYLTWRQKALT